MININDIKNGMTIKIDNNIFQVLEFQHVKPGKGPAFVRTKLKNLRTGATIENTFNAGIKLETARIDKKDMEYLYSNGDTYYFMNMEDYEQIEVDGKILGDNKYFLKENMSINIVTFEGQIIGINLPDKVELKVISTEPAVKGNTTSSAMKDATLESGYIVKVPIFIDQDEVIVISTKDGKYASRA